MAGFGDWSMRFMRSGNIGSVRFECGEFSFGAVGDSAGRSGYVPTNLSQVYCGFALDDGTYGIRGTPVSVCAARTNGPCVDWTFSDETTTNGYCQFVVFGY
jgi:hypothetical protein